MNTHTRKVARKRQAVNESSKTAMAESGGLEPQTTYAVPPVFEAGPSTVCSIHSPYVVSITPDHRA